MNYYRVLDNERKRLEESIKKKEEFIQKAPQGILACYPNRDCWRWYILENCSKKDTENNQVVNGTSSPNNKKARRKYLPKTEEETAKTMALKGLYEKELLDDKQELRAINMYLNNCSSFERGNKYVERASEFSRLLSEQYEAQQRAKSERIERWLADKYTGTVPHPEELKVPTRAGFNVRSKSERDIIRLLMEHDIPFKYEQYMKYGNEDLYPDFTILSPTTGKVFLWEHNGIMDKEGYAMKKLKDEGFYYKLGYVRGKNMIVTYEQRNEGIDEKETEFIIHHMILQDALY
ncbi:MAG: hypothetical protein KBS56_02905 [Clostridiales bacterium]|nr:hypothetical protein [Candidatus Crickella equi]